MVSFLDIDPIVTRPKPNVTPDARRYRRVLIRLEGRYMREDRQEYACHTIDLSASGIALETPREVRLGERIITYFDELGRFEGPVVRLLPTGFAMTIDATERKREKLIGQLMWLANRHDLSMEDGRRHERIIPRNPHAKVKLGGEFLVDCKVVDVSVSGAMLELDARPPIGDFVVLERLRAKVVRHHPTGIAVQFVDEQPRAIIDEIFN